MGTAAKVGVDRQKRDANNQRAAPMAAIRFF
jgi:hypothetical protein